jgi:hypothetical protein
MIGLAVFGVSSSSLNDDLICRIGIPKRIQNTRFNPLLRPSYVVELIVGGKMSVERRRSIKTLNI